MADPTEPTHRPHRSSRSWIWWIVILVVIGLVLWWWFGTPDVEDGAELEVEGAVPVQVEGVQVAALPFLPVV